MTQPSHVFRALAATLAVSVMSSVLISLLAGCSSPTLSEERGRRAVDERAYTSQDTSPMNDRGLQPTVDLSMPSAP